MCTESGFLLSLGQVEDRFLQRDYTLLAKMSPLIHMLMFVSNYPLGFFGTFFRAKAQCCLSVLVRIPPSEAFIGWLRLQVKNAVCTEVLGLRLSYKEKAR